MFNLLSFHTLKSLLDAGFFERFIDGLTVHVSTLLCNTFLEGIARGLLISIPRHAL